MSPSGRRGRLYAGPEDGRLRDLSPDTTLRAFTYTPVPFDTTRDEYKIFACIDTLTPAERDLGTRVAKAAQRLKAWCSEVDQWGWPGTFEEPSARDRERKRKSLELRIREHVGSLNPVDSMPLLEYWGSLLSVEVEHHEARLDEISDEMLKLDVEELKEYVLDMHPAARSRPCSAGCEAARQQYKVMDDFSFLITQTLLSALPHHTKLKERLNTWTARVSVLREAPCYVNDLEAVRKAMRSAWDDIQPLAYLSDTALHQWKNITNTKSKDIHQKISDLGRRLDRMLDTLEGREDCLPDHWIDTFESTEADYGQWKHELTRRTIDLEVRSRAEDSARTGDASQKQPQQPTHRSLDHSNGQSIPVFNPDPLNTPRQSVESIDAILSPKLRSKSACQSITTSPSCEHDATTTHGSFASDSPPSDDESEFDEGDTVVHHILDESSERIAVQAEPEPVMPDRLHGDDSLENFAPLRPETVTQSHEPAVITVDSQDEAVADPPQTPRSWRDSLGSFSTDMSPDSSPRSAVEESPSVRNATTRAERASRPELNATMAKLRPEKNSAVAGQDSASAPWPPSRFVQKTANSAEDLERKISDILTTIPAHIRLTSGPGPNAPEVKPARSLTAKGSRTYLRAARSVSNFKAPELTLSPAKSEFDLHNAPSGRRSAAAARGDNDIKLYHLTQPGKEQPIKLFIRRVGENGERVMVRVGGGWSDLGEYLRQYAEHHGRRTASEGKFEVLGLEVKNSDHSPSRPESVMSRRERRTSVGFPYASPSTTPTKSSGLGVGISTDEAPPLMSSFHPSTPDRTEEPAIPSTTSSRSSWQGKEVGLAGPKAKKLDLSDDKLEWIEGMMKQARTVSTSAASTDRPVSQRGERPVTSGGSRPGSRAGPGGALGGKKTEFKDLGKVGGTRRLFMKGAKPA
ncbi:hypothetical protein yc1106_08235 [Curvularia clavata]|uniref:GAR domain-containing protein n=1 Tax=Curvularia clavata TaxID=95742 RepID=A0A9Q9DWY2_CURCL|nr:hypothetical protein yc1106_08235 [Curvularia clavata]